MLSYTLICALWIAVITTVVSGNYIFVLQLISVDNPSNTSADGSCCVQTESSCSSPCDIGLRICLRPAGYEHTDQSCPLLELYGDDRPRIGNWAVSGAWPGSVQLYIRATHTVGDLDDQLQLTDDVLIDNLYIEIQNLTSFSPLTPPMVFTGDEGRVEAELRFGVNCDGNWYGPFCDVECVGRDDSGGHYECNQYGAIECLEDYQNEETNCTECVPADGCLNGFCDGLLNCNCLDGWSGDLCTECTQNCSATASEVALTTFAAVQLSTHAAATTFTDLQSTPATDATSSMPLTVEISTYSATPSSSSLSASAKEATAHTTEKTLPVFLLPTVGGVAPRPGSTSTNRWGFYLAAVVVAAVGGLLLLFIVLLGIIALLTAAKRGRRRKYEISTSEQTDSNLQYDEGRLLGSTTPTSSELESSVTTFTNGNTLPQEQPQQQELHVYYHRNTPQPSATSAAAISNTPQPSATSAAEAAVVEEEEEDNMGAQSVEMEFPSGYSDPWPEEESEHCLHWTSFKSEKQHPLSKREDSETTSQLPSLFNDYQFN